MRSGGDEVNFPRHLTHPLIEEATAFAKRLAKGPTRAHAAHKTLLRTWATGGIAAADEAILDIAMPLFETADVKSALPLAIEAFKAGKPRPVMGPRRNTYTPRDPMRRRAQ